MCKNEQNIFESAYLKIQKIVFTESIKTCWTEGSFIQNLNPHSGYTLGSSEQKQNLICNFSGSSRVQIYSRDDIENPDFDFDHG